MPTRKMVVVVVQGSFEDGGTIREAEEVRLSLSNNSNSKEPTSMTSKLLTFLKLTTKAVGPEAEAGLFNRVLCIPYHNTHTKADT